MLDKQAEPNPEWNSDKPDSATSYAPWRVYNIGNNNPVELKDYIGALERALGKETTKELLPLQPGDVEATYADVDELVRDMSYKPDTKLEDGMQKFVEWFTDYYSL